MSREQVFMFAVMGHAIVMDSVTRQVLHNANPGYVSGCHVAQVIVEAAEFYKTLPPHADLAAVASDFATTRYQQLADPRNFR